MNKKHQVHNLIILDESGSMEPIKKQIISGFNELVQTIQGIEKEYPEQEHFISFVTFNGLGNKVIHFREPASSLKAIDNSKYNPDSMTPLFDAMGFSIARLKRELEDIQDYNVLVTILTDGEENASKEYSAHSIKCLVEDLKKQKWTFTYIGTDHNVEDFAVSISISNMINFGKTDAGINTMFAGEKEARHRYSQNIREQKDTSEGFYDKDKQDIK